MKQLHVSTPHCLIVTGLPGSGKTTFAKAFTETFDAPFLDMPAIRSYVSDGFPAENLVNELIKQVMKANTTFVIELPSGGKEAREELIKRVQEAGFAPLVVWVQIDPKIAEKRSTTSTKKQPAIHTKASFAKAAAEFAAPTETELPIVISGRHTTASQMRVVLKRIAQGAGRDRVKLTPAPTERPSGLKRRRNNPLVQ